MKDMITAMRNQLDTIDEEMVYLLSRRFELVKQIRKAEDNGVVLESEESRWKDTMKNLEKESIDKGVPIDIVKNIRLLIKKETLNK